MADVGRWRKDERLRIHGGMIHRSDIHISEQMASAAVGHVDASFY